MSRRAILWIVCASCCALMLAAMLWLTVTALDLDRAEREARVLAATEEAVRLALWRMELTLAPLITQESVRPYFVYSAFYPPERAYGRMFADIEAGELLMPSPLLAGTNAYVRLHFQIDPDGTLHSPEVPVGAMRVLAVRAGLVTDEELASREALLTELRPRLDLLALAAVPPLEQPGARDALPLLVSAAQDPAQAQTVAPWPENQPPPGPGPAQADAQRQTPQLLVQRRKGSIEYQARNIAQQQAFDANEALQQAEVQVFSAKGALASSQVVHGPMTARWSGAHLLLVRRVAVGSAEYLQGCILDWAAVKESLLATARDLLSHADLEPCLEIPSQAPEHLLAGIPARLIPGEVPQEPAPFFSPIRAALFVAWPCLLLAAGALLALLAGAVQLSERRGAFVSSVTHELRTPLTTFRMYAEMLAEGMVPTEEQRTHYLRTLCTQADRLGHLVENVLTYARIERRRIDFAHETLTLEELLTRTQPRLVERAAQAEMQLLVTLPTDAASAVVRTCPAAVEQILFNLVDNACKYAAGAKDARIHVDAEPDNGGARILVSDHGPGIAPAQLRKLFTPFSKSAREAANSAPGVGLGLALSRRLAREIGGDLTYISTPGDGARFALRLRR